MKIPSIKALIVNFVFVFLILSAPKGFGATADVDTSFNPLLTFNLTNNYAGTGVLQPDGKWIVFGTYNNSDNTPGGKFIQRINADGTFDPTFDCPACRGFSPTVAAVQTDGKILIGGPGRLIRVHPNGATDGSFNAQLNGNPGCGLKFLYPLAGGKTVVLCDEVAVRRLNSNGSWDATFADIPLGPAPVKFVAQMVILPDEKILIGGGLSGGGGWLQRHNTDGTLDGTFTASPNGGLRGVGLLANGMYLVTGVFTSINGSFKPNIARLNTDGSVDTGFTAALGFNDYPENVRTLPNGQFYIRTRHSFFPSPTSDSYRTVRYNDTGSIDSTFAQTFFNSTYFWEVDAQGRIFTFRSHASAPRYYRLNIDGSVDSTFNTVIKVPGKMSAAAVQGDGKILVAGQFEEANGAAVIRFTRLNSNGTNDPTFNSGTGFDIPPDTLEIQPDGKILAAGSFTGYNFLAQAKLVRINSDGSADASFTPVIGGNVLAIAPLANGKILIGGNFTTVNGAAQKALALLNSDGSRDTSFNPVFGNSNPTVFAILMQADGKFMIGGSFSNVEGHGSAGMARFNSAGTIDTAFAASNPADVNNIAQRPDGKYVVSEWNVGGNDPSKVYRVNNNGSRDWSFQERGTGFIYAMLQQSNGNILYGGIFPERINRTGPSGEVDIFFPTYGANDTVNTILSQPDGKIIVAGLFSGIEDVGRHGIARLTLSNRIRGTAFDFDGDGRSDVSVYRPSTNTWYEILSATGSIGIQTFGASGDVIAPADYDGDGKTDLGLFRPSLGDWLFIASSTNTMTQLHFGQAGDIPLPSDSDANGTADITVYRPSTGQWYGSPNIVFGIAGDQPLIGDFDGDGKSDRAVFRPSNGDWWYAATSANFAHRNVHWGTTGDIPVPADYDGDAKTDFAVFRPSDGGWYIYNSGNGSFTILAFGTNGDRPVAADYDGDGRADIAVYRPSTGIWYLYQTTSGSAGLQFGVAGDIPTPNAFVP